MNLCSDQLQFMPIYVVNILQLKKLWHKFMLRPIAIYAHLRHGKYAKLNKHKFELV